MKSSYGKTFYEGIADVTTTGAANLGGLTTVYFSGEFDQTPSVHIVKNLGATGTYIGTDIGTTSMKIQVTGEAVAAFTNATFSVGWSAWELL